ncbi:eukaryotic translation initiation factor 4G-like [Bidens hawaiensis]|uniref:eukaryotic translation initiation factor 4G-like n=1 Tax=Bidens hawaiensis TaxID=980011 RepID=UPI004049CB61
MCISCELYIVHLIILGTPVASSTGATIKPTDAMVQKSTPGLPRAPQANAVPLNSGTKGPSTPVKGPADASGAFSLQFGSISPGVINGMQVPARTSSAPPNLDEQKQPQCHSETSYKQLVTHFNILFNIMMLQTHSDSLKATSFQNSVVPKQYLPRKDLGPVDQPSEARPISKEKNDMLSSPSGLVAAHAQKSTGPPMHLPFGGPNPPLQSQNSANTSLPVPLPMHMPVGNPPPHVPPHVFFPGYQHYQGNIGYFGMGLGSQYQQQPMNFGGARTGKITHSDTHEELRLNKRADGYPNSGPSGQKSHPPQSQAFLPAVHPITFYPGSKPLTNAQTTPGFQPPRFYKQDPKQETVKQSHKDSDTIDENLTSTASAPAVTEFAKISTGSKSGGHSSSVSSSSVGVRETSMLLTSSVGIRKDVPETSNKVEGLSNVADLSASKCDNDEEGLKSSQIIGTPKVGLEVPIADIEGSKQVKEAVEPSQDNTVQDATVPPLTEHVNDVDGNSPGSISAVAKVDVLSTETSLNLGSSHDDNKADIIRKVDVDQFNSSESVSVSVPEASPLTLEVEATNLISPSFSSCKIKGTTAPKGKKKLKEIMKNADARGTTADLYNAYKCPEEKKETSAAEVAEYWNLSFNSATRKSTILSSDERHGAPTKFEPDDWEDAADISVSKIDTDLKMKHHSEDDDEMTKKYSRDFLLKFSDRFTDLPEGFEITPDITVVLAVTGVNMGRGPYPSLGKGGSDRSVVGSRLDRWPSNVGLEMSYLARGNHCVLRTTRGQPPGQYAGGILSGPMQSTGPQLLRMNSDLDRWQRATVYHKGLMPSPHTPNPVMHKAEKKYEVGKVTDEEQAKQRRLKSILNKLTPQNFGKLFDQVKQVNIDNADTLSGVIGQIFDKALMEPTFVEMYAHFCSCLAVELPGFGDEHEKITFKRLLLNKCQEEFERGEREEEANRTEEGDIKQTNEEWEEKRVKARRRMLGNIRLIGELYKKRILTERIMHECIKKLLGSNQKNPNPDEEDIEALCKLMSTIGEMIDHPKAKEYMDAYFNIMFQLSNNMALSSRVRFVLKDAIDLRKNNWQQRRKVEGPKKIEEVHRDAAQERLAQSSRLARGPTSNPSLRWGGQPMDFGPKGSAGILSSNPQMGGGYQALPQQQLRVYGSQVSRFDSFENRTLSVPLRPMGDEAITLGPQGGLAKGMSVKGLSTGYGAPSRDDLASRYISERFSPLLPNTQEHNMNYGNRDSRNIGRGGFDRVPPFEQARVSTPPQNDSADTNLSEDRLHDMSIQAIKEFYSARDEKEVALCIKDLNAPGFHPSMISIWVTDSFERKEMDRELLAKLLINLTKSQQGILSQVSLVRGLESVLSTLEDAVNDAPKAGEFLGRMLARILLENVIPYKEVWRLIYEGDEKQGRLVEIGLAAEVVGVILEIIKSEKGDLFLNDMRTASNLRVEVFRSSNTSRLDKFI